MNTATTPPAVSSNSASLCWYGTLPATGEVTIKVPQPDYNEDVDGYFKWGTTTAKKGWNGKNTQLWLGKNPEYQSVPAGGIIFNAFTERVIRQGDSPDFSKVPWPGGIIKLTRTQFEKVVISSFRHIYRVDLESKRGKLLYLDIGKHPEIDPNDPMTRPLVTESMSFDPRTDRYIAEFVYLKRVWDPEVDKTDEPTARDYHTLVPSSMDAFFDRPPESIADTYMPDGKPKKKG